MCPCSVQARGERCRSTGLALFELKNVLDCDGGWDLRQVRNVQWWQQKSPCDTFLYLCPATLPGVEPLRPEALSDPSTSVQKAASWCYSCCFVIRTLKKWEWTESRKSHPVSLWALLLCIWSFRISWACLQREYDQMKMKGTILCNTHLGLRVIYSSYFHKRSLHGACSAHQWFLFKSLHV